MIRLGSAETACRRFSLIAGDSAQYLVGLVVMGLGEHGSFASLHPFPDPGGFGLYA